MKKHWYFIFVDECVLCGRDMGYRERRYGRKPGRKKRYGFGCNSWCGCGY